MRPVGESSTTVIFTYGQISINNLPLHDERTFDLWVNAFEYHRDRAKRLKLTEALKGPPDDFVPAVFRNINGLVRLQEENRPPAAMPETAVSCNVLQR